MRRPFWPRPSWTVFEAWLDGWDIPHWEELRRSERMLVCVDGLVTLLVIFLAIWVIIRPTAAADRVSTIQIMVGIVAGTVVAIGSYIAWRNLRLNQETLRVTQDRQITERFTRAIDQLGATHADGTPQLEVRLGGIYALERIARDSANDPRGITSDYWTILEVLTTYVRQNAPWPPRPSKAPDITDAPTDEGTSPPRQPRTDIQAIVTVIGRQVQWFGYAEYRFLNLHRTDLRGADLTDAHLEGALLDNTHLEGAHLFGARLEGADLTDAHLEGAFLMGTYLTGALLDNAHLEGAELKGAHLERASLLGAHLGHASLLGAHLEHAKLAGADLRDVQLRGAHLEGTVLDGAQLMNADLENAHLEGVDLRMTCGLTWEQLQSAHTDEHTQHALLSPASAENHGF